MEPRNEGQTAQDSNRHETSTSDSSRTRSVLVVDDNKELISLMVIQLTAAGFKVVTAGNAADAITAATAEKPDLAILDILMQGGSGLELARLLRDHHSVPFLFLSVLEDAGTVSKATEVGALAYLVKPQDLRQLVPLVTAALARADELAKLRSNEAHLEGALHKNRTISIAIGVLVERCRTDRTSAFMILRERARSTRRSISDAAEEILSAAESLNRYSAPSREVLSGKKPTKSIYE